MIDIFACEITSEPSKSELRVTNNHTLAYINPEGSVASLVFARYSFVSVSVIRREGLI
jgi:hypothetical protein